MWRPSGAHIRKRVCVEKEKLTKASEGIFVDEGGVTGCYRGTIATRNRIRGIFGTCRIAVTWTVPTARVAAIV